MAEASSKGGSPEVAHAFATAEDAAGPLWFRRWIHPLSNRPRTPCSICGVRVTSAPWHSLLRRLMSRSPWFGWRCTTSASRSRDRPPSRPTKIPVKRSLRFRDHATTRAPLIYAARLVWCERGRVTARQGEIWLIELPVPGETGGTGIRHLLPGRAGCGCAASPQPGIGRTARPELPRAEADASIVWIERMRHARVTPSPSSKAGWRRGCTAPISGHTLP